MRILYLFCFLVCCACVSGHAQDLKFKHLTVDNGLSQNTVTCFLQDSRGYMWIGTQDGLNRFDAYGFEVYKREIKNPYSLGSNYISALLEDAQHHIWIATVGGGLHRYDAQYNRFVKVKSIEQATIRFVLEDQQKTLWVGAGNFLYSLDRQSNKFVQYPVFSQWELTSILEYAPSRFLIGTNGGGVYDLHVKDKVTQRYAHSDQMPSSLCHNSVSRLYRDSRQNIWVGTEKGLDRFVLEQGVFEHFPLLADKTRSLIVESVKVIAGKDQEVWIGTENGGLSILDIETMRFQHYMPDTDDPESFNDLSVWSIYIDRQDRFWVGTFSGGVNILDSYGKKFAMPSLKLPNRAVNALLKDHKNRLWIGTEGGLIVQDGEKVTHYTHDPANPASLANNPVLALCQDNQNRIWAGTWAGGLSLFDEERKQFKNFRINLQRPDGLPDPNIFSIAQSQQTGQIMLGSFGGLNMLMSEAQQTFDNFDQSKKKLLSSDLVRAVFEDSKKNIWIGTIEGLNKFDLQNRQFTQYLHNNQDTNSISNNYINCFLEDSQGRFWIGTSDGLNLMINDQRFVTYNTSNGLPNNAINGILEDNAGNLCISTNKGISIFDVQKGLFTNYDQSDGLQSNQFKPGAAFRCSDGQLLFGGTNGFNAFYPEKLRTNPHIPPVVITGLRLFNKLVQIGGADSILRQDIRQTDQITLTHEQSVFTLEFVALNFTLSEKNQYAYKLAPFEADWNEVGNRREATYTNLDPGEYVFSVKASNNDGIWNEQGASIRIVVLPPWWETWWFRVLLVSVFVGSGVAFYKVRMGAIKRQKRILEQKVIERTNEIEKKNNELLHAYEEIQTTNEELHQSQEEISAQRDIVLQKNQALEEYRYKISKSIESALLIQKAILPMEDKLAELFKEYFILYRPKDVVSGDFYWASQIEDHKFLIVADCTGHGVSGAFMTMIGSALLDRIISVMDIYEPYLILENLHQQIQTVLQQERTRNGDGMDILVVRWKASDGEIHLDFAAAKRPLFVLGPADTRIQKVEGSRKMLGGVNKTNKTFEQHHLRLSPDTLIYLSTDGYADQNNKERKSFSESRFMEMLPLIRTQGLSAQKVFLEQVLDAHMQGTEQRDDILVVGVRV